MYLEIEIEHNNNLVISATVEKINDHLDTPVGNHYFSYAEIKEIQIMLYSDVLPPIDLTDYISQMMPESYSKIEEKVINEAVAKGLYELDDGPEYERDQDHD